MFSTRLTALATFAFAVIALAVTPVAQAQTPAMVEFFALGKMQKGLPLLNVAHEIVILGRDGWMHSLNPDQTDIQLRPTDEVYQPISVAELRNELRSEFGHRYEVVATKNFLVVQPKDRGDQWSRLFEQSHRGFTDYMRRRGVTVREGRFPMVAIVLPDEQAMYMEFKKLNIDVKRVSGLYAGESNRVMTHDGDRLDQVAATVRHEAAHQSAYNSGVHSRLSATPRWISEGIGQMFEPAGMTDSRTATRLADRINHDSLSFMKRTYPDRNEPKLAEAVMQLISDDTMFAGRSSVDAAYSVAWAMMFYLAEREPDKFAELLNFTSNRPPFRDYPRADRVKDFERIVGSDTFEFSKRVGWFVQSM